MDELCRSSRLFKRVGRTAAALNTVAGVQLHNKPRAFRKQDCIGRFSVFIAILKFMRMRMIADAEALLFRLFNYAVDFLRMTNAIRQRSPPPVYARYSMGRPAPESQDRDFLSFYDSETFLQLFRAANSAIPHASR